jgi:peptide chain release factor 1
MSAQEEEAFGGVREAVVAVGGGGVYGRLKHESGVHRVQRVPVTQSTGKLQTSTMTVTLLPEAEEVDIDVRAADLRIDT